MADLANARVVARSCTHTQVAIRESWGQRQGNTAFNTLWAAGEWADAQCTRCRAWEMQVGAACEPAMWLDASACFDDSQAAADAARRAAEQSTVRFGATPLAARSCGTAVHVWC